MRAIHLAHLDKLRPAVIMTRETVRSTRTKVTVAPISTTVRGLKSEVHVGPLNGLDRASVVQCDNLLTVSVSDLGPQIGFLRDSDEPTLARALIFAFDLRTEELP